MAVFTTPAEHAANPPESWRVVKVADRAWRVITTGGTVLEHATTKRHALELIESGTVRRTYDLETRWYAGETVPGWRPYAVTR
jgi:hypothetical protein